MSNLLTIDKPDEKWAPAHYTKSLSPLSRGDEIAEFTSTALEASRGMKEEEKLELMDWQIWLMMMLFEQRFDNGYFRYRRALIGVPKKNGKSLMGSIIALYFLIFSKAGTQIYSAARNSQQARIVFEEAKAQVIKSPMLSKLILVRKDYLQCKRTGAKYKPISSDALSQQGVGPYVVVYDEVHAAPDADLWDTLAESTVDQPEAMLIGITTAGGRKDSFCGRLYDYGVKVAAGEIIDPFFGFFWWEASTEDPPDSPATWAKANPNFACGLLSASDFRASYNAANGSENMTSFLRYKLNMWVRLAGQDFISSEGWHKAKKMGAEIPLGAKVTLGFDGSRTDDSTGITIHDLETGVFKLYKGWEKPSDEDSEWKVPRHEVEETIDELFELYDVRMLYGDIAYWGTDLDNWARKYRKRVMGLQGNPSRMNGPVRNFLADIQKGNIFHDGGFELSTHVLNAVMKDNGLPAKEKPNSPRKIDFLMCAILGNEARRHAMALAKKSKSNGKSY